MSRQEVSIEQAFVKLKPLLTLLNASSAIRKDIEKYSQFCLFYNCIIHIYTYLYWGGLYASSNQKKKTT